MFLKVDVELLNRGLVPCERDREERKKKTHVKIIITTNKIIHVNFAHFNITSTEIEIKAYVWKECFLFKTRATKIGPPVCSAGDDRGLVVVRMVELRLSINP